MKKIVPVLAFVLACNTANEQPGEVAMSEEATGFEPPVVTNPESPVEYPPDLFDRGVEGTVTLRLFVDETGAVFPDSAAVVESSGSPELDTAALRGVGRMQFSPALQNGVPVASTFLQPVEFKNSETAGGGDNQ